jgi:AcrR family transcriptional regulator
VRRATAHAIVKKRRAVADRAPAVASGPTVRERVLKAAFSAFMEKGYDGASTLEIATRAKVSKRELYALFEDKLAMLEASIDERARRMRMPLALPVPNDRATLIGTLSAFGATVMREVSSPAVMAVHRLAIAEADRSPDVARVLENVGRAPTRQALADLIASAQARGLLGTGDPAAMVMEFLGLLWGDLLLRLLLRVAEPPKPAVIEKRARAAAQAICALHPGTKP